MAGGISRIITRLSHSDAIMRVEPVVVAFTTANPIPGPWPTCIPSPLDLQTVHTGFKEANKAAQTGEFLKVAERNALRPGYNETFIDFTDFVQLAARKDPTLLLRGGYDYFRKSNSSSSTASRNILTAPDPFSVQHGTKGVLIGKASPIPGVRAYEVHFTEADPKVEASWKLYTVFHGCSKMMILNLEPGKIYTFRVRAVRANEWGPWSQYVTVMAI